MATEKTEKKRPGRKPMTEAQKAASAKLRAAEKEKAKNLKPAICLQYEGDGTDIKMDDLVAAAIADFKSENKRKLVTGLEIYIKPQERAAYYVVNNGAFTGKITF